jgi:hypothetical protein
MVHSSHLKVSQRASPQHHVQGPLLFVMPELCDRCGAPLVEIDHYGERLIGCVKMQSVKWRGGKSLVIELSQSDLEALRALMDWSAKQSRTLIRGTAN